jgi:hypothetical protein
MKIFISMFPMIFQSSMGPGKSNVTFLVVPPKDGLAFIGVVFLL